MTAGRGNRPGPLGNETPTRHRPTYEAINMDENSGSSRGAKRKANELDEFGSDPFAEMSEADLTELDREAREKNRAAEDLELGNKRRRPDETRRASGDDDDLWGDLSDSDLRRFMEEEDPQEMRPRLDADVAEKSKRPAVTASDRKPIKQFVEKVKTLQEYWSGKSPSGPRSNSETDPPLSSTGRDGTDQTKGELVELTEKQSNEPIFRHGIRELTEDETKGELVELTEAQSNELMVRYGIRYEVNLPKAVVRFYRENDELPKFGELTPTGITRLDDAIRKYGKDNIWLQTKEAKDIYKRPDQYWGSAERDFVKLLGWPDAWVRIADDEYVSVEEYDARLSDENSRKGLQADRNNLDTLILTPKGDAYVPPHRLQQEWGDKYGAIMRASRLPPSLAELQKNAFAPAPQLLGRTSDGHLVGNAKFEKVADKIADAHILLRARKANILITLTSFKQIGINMSSGQKRLLDQRDARSNIKSGADDSRGRSGMLNSRDRADEHESCR